ncbi:putative deacetylase LmbE-like domain-containing protein [Lipomyces kononenkoae]|uniref:Deacetylase LmbE-like domain-containing protein n=1 Tax=Lipomyces kononenkoae TaxID=34357 RepID=A0ACC3SZU0_LIPKO
MMRLRKVIIIVLIPVVVWLITKYILRPSNARTLKSHFAHRRIAMIIAHPDDEAMFFGPTLNALRTLASQTNPGSPELPETNLRIICLSTGNADNLGEIRTGELRSSAAHFGIPPSNVIIFDDPRVQDQMGIKWPTDAIASLVGPYLMDVDVVITFDNGGVSGHGNHMSINDFAREFLIGQGESSREVWVLKSTSILRKYISFLDIPYTYISNHFFHGGSKSERSLVLVSDVREYANTRDAMTKAHKSQMRWFRWGWISLSRYMVVNDLHLL